MAGIKSKNTKPEIIVRKMLHRRGFRFRLHSKKVTGKPDLSLRKYNAFIFVHGCFWHKHTCPLFKMPSSRTEFWEKKFETNKSRDKKVISDLLSQKYRVCVVWECALKNKSSSQINRLIDDISDWLLSTSAYIELSESSSHC